MANNKIGYYCATNDNYIYVNIKGSASSLDEFKASVNANPLVFYYELDSEKIVIDGNEAVTKLKNDLSVIGKCKNLLKPTLQTTTHDGVTCTSNGDGDTLTSDVAKVNSDLERLRENIGEKIEVIDYSHDEPVNTTQSGVTISENYEGEYTLTGTATDNIEYLMFSSRIRQYNVGGELPLKLVCCPPRGSESTFWVSLEKATSGEKFYDYGDGVEITPLTVREEKWKIRFHIKSGYDTSKIPGPFSPHLTPDLKATYADTFRFIGPYRAIMKNIQDIYDNVGYNYNELYGCIDRVDSRLIALCKKYGDNEINVGRKLNSVTGLHSVAEGKETVASGDNSHAEGVSTTAYGLSSHAENCLTKATGNYSHAGGYNTEASGEMSYTDGGDTKATAPCSHAEGRGTIASGWEQHVQGKYNEADTSGKYAHIIGGGADDSNRKNIHTVDWEGNAEYAGNVTSTDSSGNKTSLNDLITGIDLKNTSGHVTKVHVDFLNVGGQKIVLQGSVSGAAGDFFSVSKNDNVGFDLKVDNTFVVPEPVTKLLYSDQGDFRSTVVGTITITHGPWSDDTKSISANIVFNNNYNFTSAAVMSGIVYFDF